MDENCLKAIILNLIQLNGGSLPSEARLNKILYYADWIHAIKTGLPFSGLTWTRNLYGPHLPVLDQLASAMPEVSVGNWTSRKTGRQGKTYHCDLNLEPPGLAAPAVEALRLACKELAGEFDGVVLAKVYETPPMQGAAIGDVLDLAGHAAALRREKAEAFGKQVLPRHRSVMEALAR